MVNHTSLLSRLAMLQLAVVAFGINLSCTLRTPLPAQARTVRPGRAVEGIDFGIISPQNQSIRVLAIGDFGKANQNQMHVADQIARYHSRNPLDIALTLGDNFYCGTPLSPNCGGVRGLDDPIWNSAFEQPYGRLGIVFYATLGNHDYFGDWQSEINFSSSDHHWQMPARYYTFRGGPVQFFALDTALKGNNNMSESALTSDEKSFWSGERSWLIRELSRSTSAWKVVFGHRPILSSGTHGPTRLLWDDKELIQQLQRSGVIFIAGHDHDLEHLEIDGIHAFVSGGGGGDMEPLFPHHKLRESKFFHRGRGFLVFTAGETSVKFEVITTAAGVKPYVYTIGR